MFKSILKIAAATALVVGIHSLLASKTAKNKASDLFGERIRHGLYCPLYNALAMATFGALALYAWKLPNLELYKIRRPISWLMHAAQIFFLLFLTDAVRRIGFLKFAGVPNIIALAAGQTIIPIEPEGQGPILESPDEMKITGPFRFNRHPLNFGMIPIIWLMPRMTVNLAAFNFVTTAYLILGSLHEEKRLIETYGQAYVDYQRIINFLMPYKIIGNSYK